MTDWKYILKTTFDIGIYNECCEEAKKSFKEKYTKEYKPSLVFLEEDCIDFRRVLEVFMFDATLDILTAWDNCLEENGQPSMDWHFDQEPSGNLQEMYDELKDAIGDDPIWRQLYEDIGSGNNE